jgi:hypothetical protein
MQNEDNTEQLEVVVLPEESAQETLLNETEDNKHYYHERSHVRKYWIHVAPIIFVAILIVFLELVLIYQLTGPVLSDSWFLYLTLIAIMLLAICYYLFVRERWMYRNWTLELNPEQNAITLYRHGNRKLFIPERNARTIPIAGSAVTKNEQNAVEQYVFTRSSTVTLDNDIQGDEMFHDMKYIRDGYRLREAIIWYNNLHRREERAELEVLVEVRELLSILVQHFCPGEVSD